MRNKKGNFIIITIITMSILMSTMYLEIHKDAKADSTSYNDTYSDSYKDKLIRFHVLANSDSPKDQELKLKVRDKIMESMKSEFEKSTSIEQTRRIVSENIDKMKKVAIKEIKENGKSYDVNIELGTHNFPTRTYGDFTLPAGEYEAVRILIGKAKGENWWCVMFPPLCFVDAGNTQTNNNTKQTMKEHLTEEEYKNISTKKDYQDEEIQDLDGKVILEEENTLKPKSKILELIQKYI